MRSNHRSSLQFSTRVVFAALSCLFLCEIRATGQAPVGAANGPKLNLSVGYCYVSRAVTSSNRVGLNGADASITITVHHHLALRGDLSYGRAVNVRGSGSYSDILSYMGGASFLSGG